MPKKRTKQAAQSQSFDYKFEKLKAGESKPPKMMFTDKKPTTKKKK